MRPGRRRRAPPRPGLSRVTWYRLYLCNPLGRIRNVDEIRAADDGDAVILARQLGHRHRVEVWQGRRLVAEIPARATAA